MISRQEAHRIAEDEIVSSGLGTGVSCIALVGELRFRLPCLYNAPDLSTCWIAYAKRAVVAIRESAIVLVDRETGEVRYRGGANDEG